MEPSGTQFPHLKLMSVKFLPAGLAFLGLTHLLLAADLLLQISNLSCIIGRGTGIKFHTTSQLGETCATLGMGKKN